MVTKNGAVVLVRKTSSHCSKVDFAKSESPIVAFSGSDPDLLLMKGNIGPTIPAL